MTIICPVIAVIVLIVAIARTVRVLLTLPIHLIILLQVRPALRARLVHPGHQLHRAPVPELQALAHRWGFIRQELLSLLMLMAPAP